MKTLILFFVIVAICFDLFGCINATKSEVMESMNHMSLDLFKAALQNEPANFICSPISISQMLAIASFGARGTTILELQRILRFENLQIQKDSFDISKYIGQNTTMITQMYVDDQVQVDRTYEWQIDKMFNSKIKKLDFKNVGDTVKTINNWVEEKTNNHITNLITNDDVTDNNGIFWVNVIYFEGIWYNKFGKIATKNKEFFLNKENTINVPTMTLPETELKYKKIDNLDAHIVELPFKIPGEEDTDEPPIESDERVSMFIIYPDKNDGLKRIEEHIDQINLTSLFDAERRLIILTLPKFKLETKIDVKNYMKKMGMIDTFSDNADFSGIAKGGIHIGKISQKAFIEVNEDGIVATAASTISMRLLMASKWLKLEVNRPFLVILATKKVILFAARINDPRLN